MTTEVPIHARKPLTKAQRAKLFLEHGGKCCICGERIAEVGWIDEHVLPLWLGGTNDWSNRGPAHVGCARDKTSKEATERGHVMRLRRKHGLDPDNRKPKKAIQSRGFQKGSRPIPSRPFSRREKTERRED